MGPHRAVPTHMTAGARWSALDHSGQLEAGIGAARQLLQREIARVGDKHFDTAAARGTLAIGLARAGKDGEAIKEFKEAIPGLMSAARENADDDDAFGAAARQQRLQLIVEDYIALLATRQNERPTDFAAETFGLADAIRGQSVQRALTASSARMTATDPALSDLIRKEQDLSKQVNAELGVLNNAVSLPSKDRDEAAIRGINAAIDKARAERTAARREIAHRFPQYAELIDPKRPTIEGIKVALRPGEAVLRGTLVISLKARPPNRRSHSRPIKDRDRAPVPG
jgi:hypothetical protein